MNRLRSAQFARDTNQELIHFDSRDKLSREIEDKALCYNKVVSTLRDEQRLHAASMRAGVKHRVSECSRGLGNTRGLGSKNTS